MGRDFKESPPKHVSDSAVGKILASKTSLRACEIPFMHTIKQSSVLRKAELTQSCGILVPEILGNDLDDF